MIGYRSWRSQSWFYPNLLMEFMIDWKFLFMRICGSLQELIRLDIYCCYMSPSVCPVIHSLLLFVLLYFFLCWDSCPSFFVSYFFFLCLCSVTLQQLLLVSISNYGLSRCLPVTDTSIRRSLKHDQHHDHDTRIALKLTWRRELMVSVALLP